MKKKWLLFLFLTMQCIARGQTAGEVTGFDCRLLIDGEEVEQTTLAATGGHIAWNVDVMAIPAGVHRATARIVSKNSDGAVTSQYESLFYRVAADEGINNHNVTARCYIDGTLHDERLLNVDGGLIQWPLDVNDLPMGLHTVKVIVTDAASNGTATSCYNTLFYKGETTSPTGHHLQGYCYVDGELMLQETLAVDAGAVQWNLDMAALPEGLHNINVMVVDETTAATTWSYQSLFYRQPIAGTESGFIGWDYWVNQDYQGHGEVSPRQEVYLLGTILTVTEQPIRSTSFHFAVEDDKPVVYAQNDLCVMFHDASGKEVSATADYTDVRTRREVTDAILLQSGETATMSRPAENEIKWYKVEALAGDSLLFKTGKACTWQLFSPTGKELYNISGTEATNWGGVMTAENGTHYVAVHDMSVTGTTLDISFRHVDGQFVINESDYLIIKQFHEAYGNDSLIWDLSDRNHVQCDGLSLVMGRVESIELPGKGLQGGFPTMLLGLERLRTLDLSDNALSGDAAAQVADYAAEHDGMALNLQELNIARNNMEGNVGALAALLPQLTRLNANGNRFTEVSPMIDNAVTLDLSDQSLTVDVDITGGWVPVIGSLPQICNYDHSGQRFVTAFTMKIADITQSPQWSLNMTTGGGNVNGMTATGVYRGNNGQAITGETAHTNGSWRNHQTLSGKFTFNKGDANLTGDVDVTDLQAIINHIFNDDNKPFNFTAANLNGDGTLNVQDVVGEVNLLLSMDLTAHAAPGNRRAPVMDGGATQASLYWEGNTLYLYSPVDVAAIDMVNVTEGNISWDVARLGLTASVARSDEGEHAVIFSMGEAVIPAGVTAIATATATVRGIAGAKLSDSEANEIPVKYSDAYTGLDEIDSDGLTCRMADGRLTLMSGKTLHDVDVMVCAIDGRVTHKAHIGLVPSGKPVALDCGPDADNGYRIIVVRASGQVIAIQKTTQIK